MTREDRRKNGLLGNARKLARRVLEKAAERITSAAGLEPRGRWRSAEEGGRAGAGPGREQPSGTREKPAAGQPPAWTASGSGAGSGGGRVPRAPAPPAAEEAKPAPEPGAEAGVEPKEVTSPAVQHAEPVPAGGQPAAGSEPAEPFGLLDLEEPPETYGENIVMVMPRDPHWLFAYWEVTPEGRDAARASLGTDGALVLRLLAVTGRPEGGTETHTEDIALDWDHGRRYCPSPRPGAHVTAAVGLLSGDGRFAPIAHSPRILVPFPEPGPEGPIEWMEIAPPSRTATEPQPPQARTRGPAEAVPGAFKIPGELPGWTEGVWRHFPGSAAPPRPGVPGPGVPSWEELPSSPWRWRHAPSSHTAPRTGQPPEDTGEPRRDR